MSRNHPRWLGSLGLLAISTLLVLIGAELFLRYVLPYPDPYRGEKIRSGYIPSQHLRNLRLVIQIEPGLPGLSGRNAFTTNGYGFRGAALQMPKPADELRVFLVGGSTTECLGLPDESSIERVLERRLQQSVGPDRVVRAYNAGKSGDRTPDHIAMIAHRIVHLQPDVVVVFAGVNDLLGAMTGYDYLHFARFDFDRWRLLRWTLTEFQIPRRVHAVARTLWRDERDVFREIGWRTSYREKARIEASKPPAQEPPRTDLKSYGENLRTLAGIAQAHGMQLVFMTQASTWDSKVDPGVSAWHWMRYRNGVVYSEAVMSAALERYNDVMRQVAAEFHLPLYDLAREAPKSRELFFDDVHFNIAGARFAGEHLAPVILQRWRDRGHG